MTKRIFASAICLTGIAFSGLSTELAFRPSPSIPSRSDRLELSATATPDRHTQASIGRKSRMNTPSVTAEDISGEYTFLINDIYYEDSVGTNEQTGWINIYNDEAELDCEGFPLPVPATYDAESATLTFTAAAMGRYNMSNGNAYYIRFEPFFCDYEAERFVMTEISVKYNEAEHLFEFPEYHGFSWVAYTTEDYDSPTAAAGIVSIFDILTLTKHIEEWDFYDTATFIDGWIIPAFGRNQYNVPWTVNVDRHKEIPDLYRINEPYTSRGCIVDNYATVGGSIVFSLSDPEHVEVLPGYFSGMVADGNSVENTNIFGYAVHENEGVLTREEIISALENEGGVFDTYDAKTGTVKFNTCRIQINGQGCYYWSDENNASLESKMTGSLKFDTQTPSGVIGIESCENEEEETYYNMQGIRINGNPDGLCIMKRNGKTVKIVR